MIRASRMAQFSAPHLAALAALCLLCAGAVVIGRRLPGPPTEALRLALAGVILAAWLGEYAADVIRGTWSARYDLPLQLTDAVSVVSVLALVTRRRALVELTWFWAMSASLQATVTPDLSRTFPSVYYFTYFGYHDGAVAAALLLVVGCGIYPRRGRAVRAFALAAGWAALAGVADLILDANYMYLRSAPAHSSLLALLGPWPWYVLGGAAIGLLMVVALDWVAAALRRRDRRFNLLG